MATSAMKADFLSSVIDLRHIRRLLRFRLAHFLIAVGIAGAGLGLYIRSQIDANRYTFTESIADSTKVIAMWERRDNKFEPHYLTIFPTLHGANVVGAGRGSKPREGVVSVFRQGIFVDGQLVEGFAPRTIWLYCPTDRQFRRIDATEEEIASITHSHIKRLKELPVWQTKIKPEVEIERQRFRESREKLSAPKP